MHRSAPTLVWISSLLAVTLADPVFAQLADSTQITPTVPGGQIAKSLEQQVGAGHGDELTAGSAVYLIKRDPARSIRRGRQLFQRKFTATQGLGPRMNADANGNIREMRALGAGLVDSCAGCHGRPRGSAGFGGDVVTRPDSRDAPHLFGLGLQEMLADEITIELRAIRARALRDAAAGRSGGRRCRRGTPGCGTPGPVSVRLVAKGIDFGRLTAFPDGSVDTSRVDGVDADLRVRPFFHHGETISIREFAIGAFDAEMGLQASDPVLCAATDPSAPAAAISPAGFSFDPSLDRFERPPGCESSDPDGDGAQNEIDPALIDHMEFYLLNYFKPGLGKQTLRTQRGRARMDTIGCTSCHVGNLVVESDRRVADVETVHDPVRGIFNRLFATAETRFVAIDDGGAHPLVLPAAEGFVVKNFFADFKRHDLGPAFHEREYDGTLQTEFLTEALWGVGSTAPYGHDGRSINLEEVILRHGGEARGSRDAFARLTDGERHEILDFLATLVLFPPDDTASNLNPGNPSGNIQDPAGHGTINLGALFQIPEEGAE
jgi:Di-haem oxidoreductase, putative peroxidase